MLKDKRDVNLCSTMALILAHKKSKVVGSVTFYLMKIIKEILIVINDLYRCTIYVTFADSVFLTQKGLILETARAKRTKFWDHQKEKNLFGGKFHFWSCAL